MRISPDRKESRGWARVPVVGAIAAMAAVVALSSGCASSHGSGKIAKEIQNLPNGLVADTKDADHTNKTLQQPQDVGVGD